MDISPGPVTFENGQARIIIFLQLHIKVLLVNKDGFW